MQEFVRTARLDFRASYSMCINGREREREKECVRFEVSTCHSHQTVIVPTFEPIVHRIVSTVRRQPHPTIKIWLGFVEKG
jgi:hypothetical protein